MSRNKAFKELRLEEYKKQMEGIFTTCINRETIDESPMAYKPLASIWRILSLRWMW